MITLLHDALGREHRFENPPARIVSLVPSLTETLVDLGAQACIAGVTDFCIFPAETLANVPRVGGTKTPRIDAIRALAPDLVYVNLEENLRRHAEAIEEFAPVFATEPKSVLDVERLITRLGLIHGVKQRAVEWATALLAERVALAGSRPFRFACAIWKEPWMWCGGDTYVSDLVVTAGGVNVLASEPRYPRRPLEDVLALEPEIVFLPDEPYAFTEQDAAELRGRGAARVIGPFPGHLFTWHGTRTVAGLRFLRETLQPTPPSPAHS